MNSWGPNPSLQGERKILRGVFTSSIKRLVMEFAVVVVKRRQRNVQKVCCTCRVAVSRIEPIAFLDVLVAVAILVAKAPYSSVIRLRCVFLFLAGLRGKRGL